MARRSRGGLLVASLILLSGLTSPGYAQNAIVPPGQPGPAPGAVGYPPPGEVSRVPETAASAPVREVAVWGTAGLRAFAFDDQIAPNGLEFKALFSLDLDFNVWLWRAEALYLFTDARFWGQRAVPGITNPGQGAFDFSKREFDLSGGLAWNYYDFFEARAFAYSFNNLNRGVSSAKPTGYADGVGLENRSYLGSTYADLGTEAFDVNRATFVSVGFYPTKDMVDSRGMVFKPGPFARAFLTLDLCGECCYLYGDLTFTATRMFTPKLLDLDAGVAVRPWGKQSRFELRLGTTEMYDLRNHDVESGLYGALRIAY